MTNEQIYDAEIAPKLLEISKRCQELGFAFVANVEWEVGETGRTEFCPATDGSGPRPSAKQLLVHYAARCHGNIDAMLMAVVRDAEKFGHSSMYLYRLGVKETPAGAQRPSSPTADDGDRGRQDNSMKNQKATKRKRGEAVGCSAWLGPDGRALQPIALDKSGVARFKVNAIVRLLLDDGKYDMNRLALLPFSKSDREQFAQLIGYSVSGFGELNYASNAAVSAADEVVAKLVGPNNAMSHERSELAP